MTEMWKPAPGYEGKYEVSDLGNVRSLPQRVGCPNGFRVRPGKVLSKNRINSGYEIVHLYHGEKRTALLVHRLVVTAFIGEIPSGMTVNHKNGIKTDNRASNLEVLSYTDNHLHAVNFGLNKQAQRVRSRCLKTGAVCEFASMAEGARGVAGCAKKESVVRRAAQGQRKTAYGHTWEIVS